MKKTLTSGATLEITRAPFETGHRLFKAVLREMKTVDLKLGLKDGQSLGNLTNDFEVGDQAINTFKDAFCTILSSQEIEDVLRECFPRALYNNKKIDLALFDNDEQAAQDYLEISKEVMLVNLAPFAKSLASLFPGPLAKRIIESQKLQ